MSTPKAIATLRLNGWPELTPMDKIGVIDWLRSNARILEELEGDEFDRIFTARFYGSEGRD